MSFICSIFAYTDLNLAPLFVGMREGLLKDIGLWDRNKLFSEFSQGIRYCGPGNEILKFSELGLGCSVSGWWQLLLEMMRNDNINVTNLNIWRDSAV